ncbi:MAG: helix-turn-helix transcriptional regulator [Symbiobacteriia bacterium]
MYRDDDRVKVNTETLKEARAKKGLSQAAVAEAVGISRSFYVEIEGGKSPSLATSLKIARFFERPVADLFLLRDVAPHDAADEQAATAEAPGGPAPRLHPRPEGREDSCGD